MTPFDGHFSLDLDLYTGIARNLKQLSEVKTSLEHKLIDFCEAWLIHHKALPSHGHYGVERFSPPDCVTDYGTEGFTLVFYADPQDPYSRVKEVTFDYKTLDYKIKEGHARVDNE